MKIHTSYLDEVLDIKLFNKLVNAVAAKIKLKAPTAQAIAFRGCSGSLIGMAVCAKCKLHPILVRKPESSHTNREVEGAIEADRYVIVDDFVGSGDTVRSIMDERRRYAYYPHKLLGVFCYAETERTRRKTINGKRITIHRCKI